MEKVCRILPAHHAHRNGTDRRIDAGVSPQRFILGFFTSGMANMLSRFRTTGLFAACRRSAVSRPDLRDPQYVAGVHFHRATGCAGRRMRPAHHHSPAAKFAGVHNIMACISFVCRLCCRCDRTLETFGVSDNDVVVYVGTIVALPTLRGRGNPGVEDRICADNRPFGAAETLIVNCGINQYHRLWLVVLILR